MLDNKLRSHSHDGRIQREAMRDVLKRAIVVAVRCHRGWLSVRVINVLESLNSHRMPYVMFVIVSVLTIGTAVTFL